MHGLTSSWRKTSVMSAPSLRINSNRPLPRFHHGRKSLPSIRGHFQAVIHDVERIGQALGEPARGRVLADSLSSRLRMAEGKLRSLPRPRVLCLEWLRPLYVGGHWVPEMVEDCRRPTS